MSEKTDSLSSLLEPFGLSADEAKIYLVLLEFNVLSALDISRKLHISRTKVYRLLDNLIASGLVINQFDTAGFKFVASPPEKLSLIINQRQTEVSSLKKILPEVTKVLQHHMGSGKPGTRVRYYRDHDGLVQANYNLLRAKGKIFSFEISDADAFMTHKEAESLRRELVEQKITINTISNQTTIPEFTDVTKLVTDYWEIRSISKKVFDIKAEVFIYNDVYLMYQYQENDVFGVEIYNQYLADMHRQVFSLLWKQAKRMKVVNPRGKAVLNG